MNLSLPALTNTLKQRFSLASVIMLICLSVVWWQASRWYEAYLLDEQAQQFDQQVDSYAQNLANILNKRFALLQGLTSFVETDLLSAPVAQDETVERIETFLTGLRSSTNGIRNFAIAPDGIIQTVSPLRGNEASLGHDLLNDTRLASRKATIKTLQMGRIALTSPMELLQGGEGVVARQAIYHNGRLWGLVSMALDLLPVLSESGLLDPNIGLRTGLRDDQGNVFFGEKSVFERSAKVHVINLPDGRWELSALPLGSEESAIVQQLLVFQSVLAAFFLMIIGLFSQRVMGNGAGRNSRGNLLTGRDSEFIRHPGPPAWLAPVLTFCALFMATAALYWFVQRSDDNSQRLNLNNAAATIEHDIQRRLDAHKEYFQLLATQISQGQLSAKSYQQRVSQYVYDHPGLVNVTWADDEFVIRDTAPYEENKQVVGLKLLLPEPERASYEAFVTRQPAYTKPFVVIQGHPAFELYVPIYAGEKFLGTLGAVYKIEYLLDGLLSEAITDAYKIDFIDRSGEVIYGATETQALSRLSKVLAISSLNEELWIRLTAYDVEAEQGVRLLFVLLLLLATGIGISLWLQYRENRTYWQEGEALRESQRHFRAIAQASPMAIVISHPTSGKIVYANAQTEKLFDYAAESVVGNLLPDYFVTADDYQRFAIMMQEHRHLESFEALLNKSEAEPIWVSLSSQMVMYGNEEAVITSIIDLSERKNHENKLFEQANYDALTKLPNRGLAFDRLQDAMARARRTELKIALMMLDLDHFKTVNDNLGHTAGDQLLKEISQRLCHCVREGDTVARLGGDEFTLILPELHDAMDAEVIADKIIQACSGPVLINGHEVSVSASIGITIFPNDGTDQETLLKNADTAMYKCKEDGRNHFHFYTEEMNQHAQALLKMELELRKALSRDEFSLYYQPLICTQTGVIMGVEALLRWDNAELGRVPPDAFIPLAESMGLINELGEWVLQTAVQQIRQWRQLAQMPQYVAVNVSVQQLRQGGFVDLVTRTLDDAGLPPEALELEITETVLLDNTERNRRILNVLDAMGVRLSIDDFGTGYSSLSYLGRFPFDTLKIDRSFINDIAEVDEAAQLTSAIISMAEVLGLRVVAEGVETQEQLDFLSSLKCELTQGFYLAKPMPADEFERFVMDYKPVCGKVIQA